MATRCVKLPLSAVLRGHEQCILVVKCLGSGIKVLGSNPSFATNWLRDVRNSTLTSLCPDVPNSKMGMTINLHGRIPMNIS